MIGRIEAAHRGSATTRATDVDIVAHGWWMGLGLAAVAPRVPLRRRSATLAVGLAMLPDLVHLLPVAVGSLSSGAGLTTLRDYALALPGTEPPMPSTTAWLTHHLHCVLHSAVVAALVSVSLWVVLGRWWLPLLGWWSHIVIDVLTHSADFYPSPVLYPITYRGFDGIAWNRPGFQAANYSALAGLTLWLLWRRHRSRPAGGPAP